MDKIPTCLQCHTTFTSYYELARHLDNNKKSHKVSFKTRKWIAKMMAINTLSMKNRRDLPKRIAVDPNHEITELGEQNRANAVKELSGENMYTDVTCPQCKIKSRQLVEVEHAQSETAWRKNERMMILCGNCRSTR